MDNKKLVAVLGGIVILALVAVFVFNNQSTDDVDTANSEGVETTDPTGEESDGDEETVEVEDIPAFTHSGDLEDVSGGEGSGIAMFIYDSGEFILNATAYDIPDLEEGYFYEGWVVREGDDFNFESTGELEPSADGSWTNIYRSDVDYTDHDFYVLTLEPDDGDSAPAEHIVEGKLLPINSEE